MDGVKRDSSKLYVDLETLHKTLHNYKREEGDCLSEDALDVSIRVGSQLSRGGLKPMRSAKRDKCI